MIAPIRNMAEDYFSRQSGSSGVSSAQANRFRESQQTILANSQKAVRWMQAFFQSDREVFQALDDVAKQIEAGVPLNKALAESYIRTEIEQRLDSSRLQKILGMVREQNPDTFGSSAIGLASQLRKAEPQVAQVILDSLQQDAHLSKKIREQALAAYNVNAGKGPLTARIGRWMQDTVHEMSSPGIVPVIAATAAGRAFEAIALGWLGAPASGLGGRVLVRAASLVPETLVAAVGTQVVNSGPLSLQEWATSLAALKLSGAVGNLAIRGLSSLRVASGLQSLAGAAISPVTMFAGLYAADRVGGVDSDVADLMSSVFNMHVAADVGRGSLRFIDGLHRELEIRREISTYGEPSAGPRFALPFRRLAEATVSPGSPGMASRSEAEGLPTPADRVSGPMLAKATGEEGSRLPSRALGDAEGSSSGGRMSSVSDLDIGIPYQGSVHAYRNDIPNFSFGKLLGTQIGRFHNGQFSPSQNVSPVVIARSLQLLYGSEKAREQLKGFIEPPGLRDAFVAYASEHNLTAHDLPKLDQKIVEDLLKAEEPRISSLYQSLGEKFPLPGDILQTLQVPIVELQSWLRPSGLRIHTLPSRYYASDVSELKKIAAALQERKEIEVTWLTDESHVYFGMPDYAGLRLRRDPLVALKDGPTYADKDVQERLWRESGNRGTRMIVAPFPMSASMKDLLGFDKQQISKTGDISVQFDVSTPSLVVFRQSIGVMVVGTKSKNP